MTAFETWVSKHLEDASDERLALDACEFWRQGMASRARFARVAIPADFVEILTRCMLDEQKRRMRG